MNSPRHPGWMRVCACVLRRGLLAVLTTVLAACATGVPRDPAPGVPHIDARYQSRNQDSRVRYIILHYTQLDFAPALQTLTLGQVSSHYLVTADPPRSYRLVPEERRAWHAGKSFWRGETALNASSIGIEIVNRGPLDHAEREFAPYPDAQIDELIRLVRDIARRHGIAPHRILGHADIAPQRKLDPGPRFPWHRLFEAGLIPWPDEPQVAAREIAFRGALPSAAWYRERLAALGYEGPRSGEPDAATRRVLANFQAKYRPARCDGEPDARTAALLEVLGLPDGSVLRLPDGRVSPYSTGVD